MSHPISVWTPDPNQRRPRPVTASVRCGDNLQICIRARQIMELCPDTGATKPTKLCPQPKAHRASAGEIPVVVTFKTIETPVL
jgi:hypothetical protein